MYQPSYSAYQPLRPPNHSHGSQAPLHIQTSSATQPQYQQYSYMASPAGGGMATPRPSNGPPSPSEQSERSGAHEEDFYNLPGPPPTSHVWGGYVWALETVQHPQRARMCGFGDKDRRPISPPPCIRLIILDPTTKQEVNYDEVDLAHLVLAVDIWDLYAVRELNLVKQSNASPCISSAATGSFPTQPTPAPAGHERPPAYPISQIPNYQPYTQSTTTPTPTPSSASGFYPRNGQSFPDQRSAYSNGHNGQQSPYQNGTPPYRQSQFPYSDPRYAQSTSNTYSQHHQPPPPHPSQQAVPGTSPAPPFPDHNYGNNQNGSTQLYTRNLIGSCSASAFKLEDEHGKLGIWFVLQDLSVRTEGWFRLKMNFFNLSQSLEKQIQLLASNPNDANGSASKTSLTAPCLASAFSNPFKVFSAKKFPGVVESTSLSRAFAMQGIKIPIRKDTQSGASGVGSKRGRDGSDDDEEDHVSDNDG